MCRSSSIQQLRGKGGEGKGFILASPDKLLHSPVRVEILHVGFVLSYQRIYRQIRITLATNSQQNYTVHNMYSRAEHTRQLDTILRQNKFRLSHHRLIIPRDEHFLLFSASQKPKYVVATLQNCRAPSSALHCTL